LPSGDPPVTAAEFLPALPIRAATRDDADEIARLLSQLGHLTTPQELVQRWPAWAEAGNTALVAPRADGTLAGVAVLHRMHVLHRPRPVGRVTALVVDLDVRDRGLGRALIHAAEAACRSSGCGLIEITSHVRLLDAHGFYAHLGYERTSLRFAKTLEA
jgi:GNAT superfamily N-acetyltransferase